MKGTSPSQASRTPSGLRFTAQQCQDGEANLFINSLFLEGEVMAIVTVGIDLAKNVFAVHGVDETGRPALVRPEVPRGKLVELIAHLPPCLIGMEACSGAHHWAREFAKFGHIVRLMAPKFVAPYRESGKRGKNDAADAAAMRWRPLRPRMRACAGPCCNAVMRSACLHSQSRQSRTGVAVVNLGVTV